MPLAERAAQPALPAQPQAAQPAQPVLPVRLRTWARKWTQQFRPQELQQPLPAAEQLSRQEKAMKKLQYTYQVHKMQMDQLDRQHELDNQRLMTEHAQQLAEMERAQQEAAGESD